jgi:site-specific recombinase XerD
VNRPVAKLAIEDLSFDRVLDFLNYLEQDRGNSARTRNARLAAIHSFFAYAITREVSLAAQAQRALAIPFKKAPGRLLGYLSVEELSAIHAQLDRTASAGRRDYLVLALLYDTGGRVQELVDLRPVPARSQ